MFLWGLNTCPHSGPDGSKSAVLLKSQPRCYRARSKLKRSEIEQKLGLHAKDANFAEAVSGAPPRPPSSSRHTGESRGGEFARIVGAVSKAE